MPEALAADAVVGADCDDEDADDLERKVWARMKEFEHGVFATAFAQAKKVAKTAAPVLVSMPYAKERVDCQSAHA